mmetsp:Transcript_24700/g.69489  ORF Transcript_24700/g.69489 Transcript_24700/m.69489 type:complete len:94 (-) Transcript_24700:122-403(-)
MTDDGPLQSQFRLWHMGAGIFTCIPKGANTPILTDPDACTACRSMLRMVILNTQAMRAMRRAALHFHNTALEADQDERAQVCAPERAWGSRWK